MNSADTANARMNDDVAYLAALDRRTTTGGERRSAEWLADRLAQLGAADVALTTFRGHSSWAPAHLGHVAMGLLTGLLPAPAGTLATLGVAVSYELEVSGRNQWFRRLLPARRGVSVSARLPAAGRPRRTLVLVAHHDAAHNGLVWHPRVLAANRRWSHRTGRAVPSHAIPLAAMAVGALPFTGPYIAARAVLCLAGVAMVQSMRSHTTPGANDNATGVAAVLELARRLTAEPLPDTDVLVVFPGGEEAGNTGMRAWMTTMRGRLAPDRTLVLNLDSLGSGGHLVLARREGLTGRMARRDVDALLRIGSTAGIDVRSVTFPNVCDATIARHAGMRAATLLSYADGWVSNLHLKADAVEAVGWNTVNDAVALTEHIARAWDDGSLPA